MAQEITPEMLRPILPRRPSEGHKGTFGHVFVLAGSRGFTGAAKLTCLGAARSGVGLVTVGVPKSLGDVVAAGLIETMSLLLPATDAESLGQAAVEPALEFAADKQTVVLGPGIGQHPETRAFVEEFVARCAVPLLIDADGLNCLSHRPETLKAASAPKVLTPHPGEMARLIRGKAADVQKDREGTAKALALEYGCVVVLKGYRTVIASPAVETFVNPTGNAGLATGGTGDVLSGLIGGLMAQGIPLIDAARVGVYLHGLAGNLAAKTMTERGMIARDVVESIPAAWHAIEGND
jgi:NAD(P)H-hydrate epimerase